MSKWTDALDSLLEQQEFMVDSTKCHMEGTHCSSGVNGDRAHVCYNIPEIVLLVNSETRKTY